jgi:hypothetical protein
MHAWASRARRQEVKGSKRVRWHALYASGRRGAWCIAGKLCHAFTRRIAYIYVLNTHHVNHASAAACHETLVYPCLASCIAQLLWVVPAYY